MITITPYHQNYQTAWDEFVKRSSNGTFILLRDFIEYHQGRFEDHSVLLWKQKQLLAVFPAHLIGSQWHSHQGLSYAGLLWKPQMTLEDIIACWKALLQYAVRLEVESIHYKPVPLYYRNVAVNEDSAVLYRLGAILKQVKTSALVQGYEPKKWRKDRQQGIKKAAALGLTVKSDGCCWATYWQMLSQNLQERYGAKPVHSLEEINYLQHQFPENIQLMTVHLQSELLGGIVIFQTKNVAHLQYTASTPKGRKLHALDLLMKSIFKKFQGKAYISLGTSNIPQTLQVNRSLQSWKESWRSHSSPHEQWEIDPQQWGKLEGFFA